MNTIIFDLDGTLLPMNHELFMKYYLDSIGSYFSNTIDKETFVSSLLKASELTIHDDSKNTNEETYMRIFSELLGIEAKNLYDMFYQYYDSSFIQTKQSTYQSIDMINSYKC